MRFRRGTGIDDPSGDEDAQQIELARYLDKRGFLWCHVPNGGRRSKREGAKFKQMGVKAGVPDVLIFDPVDVYVGALGLAIEMKRADGKGRTSTAQKAWLKALADQGWTVFVAHGWRAAVRKVEEVYGS